MVPVTRLSLSTCKWLLVVVLGKTQEGVPGQPTDIRVLEQAATSLLLEWSPPIHSGENIIGYELYWNDTFSKRVRHTQNFIA